MPAPTRARPINKDYISRHFKPSSSTSQKPLLFPEPTPPATTRGPTSTTSTTPSTTIRALSWSPTGSHLATAVGSKLRIWNPERPVVRASQEFLGHSGFVERVEWRPTREGEVGSLGLDGGVRVWDVRVGGGAAVGGFMTGGQGGQGIGGQQGGQQRGGCCMADTKVGDGGLFLAWHPGGTQMVVGRRDDVIVVVDVRKGVLGEVVELETTQRGKLGSGQTNQCAFSNSGRELFATTSEGTVKILDWPSLSLLHTLPAHTSPAYSVAHSPSGTHLATGGGDSLITLWDIPSSFTCAHTLDRATTSIHSLSFSFDGTYIAGAHGPDKDSGEKGIHVACTGTGEYVHSFETQAVATAVAWHPLRYWLAYAGDPGGVRVFGMGSGGL